MNDHTRAGGDGPSTVRRWLAAIDDAPGPPVPTGPTISPRPSTLAGPPIPTGTADCPCRDWATSGAMSLTGHASGPPVLSPASAVPLLRAAASALQSLGAALAHPVRVDPLALLTGRAGALGLTRHGRRSAGGATRLLRAADGWCAVSLSRADDLELLPALLGRTDVDDPWRALTRAVRRMPAGDLAERAQMLGIPAAGLPPAPSAPPTPWRVRRIAPSARPVPGRRPLVVDLSSLWAGPLCADLLHQAGARVIKVESTRRPDGTRNGKRLFYDWLHAGHESVAVDFTTREGRTALAALIDAADVVIEASRPRALRQLGMAPEQRTHRPGKVWLAITGYGRAHPDRVAFGDDAAVAGGLVGWTGGEPVFCADAVADPLTGLVAGLGALASLATGGGHLIVVAMREVVAAFTGGPPLAAHTLHGDNSAWSVHCPRLRQTHAVRSPLPPQPRGSAAELGADTVRVLDEVAASRR